MASSKILLATDTLRCLAPLILVWDKGAALLRETAVVCLLDSSISDWRYAAASSQAFYFTHCLLVEARARDSVG